MWVTECKYDDRSGRQYLVAVNTATDQVAKFRRDSAGVWHPTSKDFDGLVTCSGRVDVQMRDLAPDVGTEPDWSSFAQAVAYVDGLIEFVGGLTVDVSVGGFADDGPGGVLAAAAPTRLWFDGTSRNGSVFVDPADMPGEVSTFVHELLHVLGFGAFPGSRFESLVVDGRFVGERTVGLWAGLDGEAGPPLSSGDGFGHWDETVFGSELMTPYLDGEAWLSGLTLEVLRDIGYQISADVSPGVLLGRAVQDVSACRYCQTNLEG